MTHAWPYRGLPSPAPSPALASPASSLRAVDFSRGAGADTTTEFLDRCRPGHSEDPLIFHRKQKLQVLAPIGRVALHRGIGNHCLRSILGGVAPGPYPSAALMAVHGWKMSAPKARQTRTTPREEEDVFPTANKPDF